MAFIEANDGTSLHVKDMGTESPSSLFMAGP